jgi:hypothetical protein
MSLSKGIGNGTGMKRRYSPAALPPEEESLIEPGPAVEVKEPLRRRVWQAVKSLFPKIRNLIIGNAYWRNFLSSFPILLAVSTLHTFFILS